MHNSPAREDEVPNKRQKIGSSECTNSVVDTGEGQGMGLVAYSSEDDDSHTDHGANCEQGSSNPQGFGKEIEGNKSHESLSPCPQEDESDGESSETDDNDTERVVDRGLSDPSLKSFF